MMRLLRGSGAAGLAAMESAGPGQIVRPMLTCAATRSSPIATSSVKRVHRGSVISSRTILRNRIRHDLLPMLERDYAPKLHRRLTGLALEMRSLDDYLAREARAELRRCLRSPERLDLTGFARLHRALASTLRAWLRRVDGVLRRIYRADIERMSRLCAVGRRARSRVSRADGVCGASTGRCCSNRSGGFGVAQADARSQYRGRVDLATG